MKVLGLDVSTTNIGVCLIDTRLSQSSRVVLAYGIPMSKVKGLYAKSCELREHILAISHDHKVDIIVVEEPLQSFRSRMSSAGTIALLNRFNGIVSFIARSELGCPLKLVNAVSARKSVGCLINRKSDVETKDQVLQWAMSQPEMEKFEWPTKILKSGPNKGKSRRKEICYDIADAFVVGTWGAIILKIDDLDDTVV